MKKQDELLTLQRLKLWACPWAPLTFLPGLLSSSLTFLQYTGSSLALAWTRELSTEGV